MYQKEKQRTTTIIEEQFIVVYDKWNESLAIHISGEAANLGITTATWNKKHYLDNKNRLTNKNKILLLSGALIQTELRLAPPKILSDGVLCKTHGNRASLYLEENCDYISLVKNLEGTIRPTAPKISLLKEEILDVISIKRRKDAKLRILKNASDKYINENLRDFLSK